MTYSQNARNSKGHSDNISGFKGVSQSANNWTASIWVDQKNKYLGIFTTPEDAARAYNAAALKYFGEYAYLNEGVDR